MTFLMNKLNIVLDGTWQTHEIIAALALLLLAALILLLLVLLIKRIARALNPRKSTIFSHRKNKYKSRLGKDNSKYLK